MDFSEIQDGQNSFQYNLIEVKKCIRDLMLLGTKTNVPLKVVDNDLYQRLQSLIHDMFCMHKKDKANFTILQNLTLKRIQISEDGEGIDELDNVKFLNAIDENIIEAFSELVSKTFLTNKKGSRIKSSHLYASKIYSRFSGEEHVIFFYNSGGNICVFQNNVTSIKLIDYISDYFSGDVKNTKEKIAILIDKINKQIEDKSSQYIKNLQFINEAFEQINTIIKKNFELISGAITFLDFLGWKGMWQRSNNEINLLESVTHLIDNFKEKLREMSDKIFNESDGIIPSQLISISDTIAVFTPKTSTVTEIKLLELHSDLCGFILESCVEAGFSIRGAITYGKYNVMNNIMIGPGIDECASWHELGDWIGVHLTPSAQMYLANKETMIDPKSRLIKTYVPLKKGYCSDWCVKWNVTLETIKQLALNSAPLLPEFSSKFTNTYKFLEGCDKNGKI